MVFQHHIEEHNKEPLLCPNLSTIDGALGVTGLDGALGGGFLEARKI